MFTKICVFILCIICTSGALAADDSDKNVWVTGFLNEFESLLYAKDNAANPALSEKERALVKQIDAMPENKRKALKLMFVAEKEFWKIYDFAKEKVNEKSKSTGRRIFEKQSEPDKDGQIHLVYGLDVDDVYGGDCDILTNGGIYCPWPDGFENAYLSVTYSDKTYDVFSYQLFFHIHNKKENKTNNIIISLNVNIGVSNSIMFSVGGSEETYEQSVKQHEMDVIQTQKVADFNKLSKRKQKKQYDDFWEQIDKMRVSQDTKLNVISQKWSFMSNCQGNIKDCESEIIKSDELPTRDTYE